MESQHVSLSGVEGRVLELYFVWAVINVVMGVMGQVLVDLVQILSYHQTDALGALALLIGQELPAVCPRHPQGTADATCAWCTGERCHALRAHQQCMQPDPNMEHTGCRVHT